MAQNTKIVKNWRGLRSTYELLKQQGLLDYWTRYSVKDNNGTWTEYWGTNQITCPSGQFLPVLDILENVPQSANPGDRYLIGKDGEEYYIVTIDVDMRSGVQQLKAVTEPFLNNSGMSVRVTNRKSMAYQLVDNVLITHDKVDAGIY